MAPIGRSPAAGMQGPASDGPRGPRRLELARGSERRGRGSARGALAPERRGWWPAGDRPWRAAPLRVARAPDGCISTRSLPLRSGAVTFLLPLRYRPVIRTAYKEITDPAPPPPFPTITGAGAALYRPKAERHRVRSSGLADKEGRRSEGPNPHLLGATSRLERLARADDIHVVARRGDDVTRA